MAEIVIHTDEGRHLTAKDLRDRLARFRGKRVPRSTLHDWLKLLAIEPDETGCYSAESFTLLARYAVWLQRGGLSKGFLVINNIQPKDRNTNGNDQQHRQQGIRTEATRTSATAAPTRNSTTAGTPDVICI